MKRGSSHQYVRRSLSRWRAGEEKHPVLLLRKMWPRTARRAPRPKGKTLPAIGSRMSPSSLQWFPRVETLSPSRPVIVHRLQSRIQFTPDHHAETADGRHGVSHDNLPTESPMHIAQQGCRSNRPPRASAMPVPSMTDTLLFFVRFSRVDTRPCIFSARHQAALLEVMPGCSMP